MKLRDLSEAGSRAQTDVLPCDLEPEYQSSLAERVRAGISLEWARRQSPFESTLIDLEQGDWAIEVAQGTRSLATACRLVPDLLPGDVVLCSDAIPPDARPGLTAGLSELGVSLRFASLETIADWPRLLECTPKVAYIEAAKGIFEDPNHVQLFARSLHAHGGVLFVENSMDTEMTWQPLLLGADLVVYSRLDQVQGQSGADRGAIVGWHRDWTSSLT